MAKRDAQHRWTGLGLVLLLLASGAAGGTCESKQHAVEVAGADCVTCHLSDYEAALDPVHVDSFPLDCAGCHDEDDWRPARFEHEWPLEGAHGRVMCASCHLGDPPDYDATPTECIGCHAHDRAGATQPDHSDFSMDCAQCHGTDAWHPAAFEHDWPLEGAHADTMCASCHPGDPPRYSGTPTECIGCHAHDRAGATQPDHSDFSMDCLQCHTTDAWHPADFDHKWPLEGAHATTMCASCHPGDPPRYSGTPTVCVDCHRADYDASPYPGHADFPTTCESCHTSSAWTPASGGLHPEGAFPIASGPHKEFECMECHNAALGPNDKDNTDCVGCHTGKHTRNEVDPKHHEVSDYPSGNAPPNFCLDCHANGRKEDD